MPAVTRTPYFRAMLGLVANNSGADAAASAEAMAAAWVRAFNGGLAARFVGEQRVAVVDLQQAMQDWTLQPASYGFTNVTEPACPSTGSDSLMLLTYSLDKCSATDLAASRPADPGWWRGYLFADDYHGSPRANRLIGALVADKITDCP